MKLQEVYTDISNICDKVNYLSATSRFDDLEDFSEVLYDNADADDLFYLDELEGIMNLLFKASSRMEYLKKSVNVVGQLHKKVNGRYEVQSVELSSGSRIEYFDGVRWRISRIEYADDDYYLFAEPEKELEGMKVRLRG